MKPKTERMIFVVTGLLAMFAAFFFILNNFRDNLVFFYTPTELTQKIISQDKLIRIGGLVEEGSISKNNNVTEFRLTDINNSVKVIFKGILPPLFREKQGIVASGRVDADRTFIADNLLTKHDEKYMPPEVAEALKRSGKWKPGQTGR
jgi:cytochrome c-type biogenesis protein CcmE